MRVVVPLAQRNPRNGTAYTLQLQNATARDEATIHGDAVRLVAGGTPPATP